jgi:hypothetical protein
MRSRALVPMPAVIRSPLLLREPLAGTTVQTSPGTPGHLPAWFWQYKSMNRFGRLSVILNLLRLTSEGFVGSNPTASIKFLQLGGLFETANRSSDNRSREPPVHAPGRGRVGPP